MAAVKEKTTLVADIPKEKDLMTVERAQMLAESEYRDAVRDAAGGDVDGRFILEVCRRVGRTVEDFRKDTDRLKHRLAMAAELENLEMRQAELMAANAEYTTAKEKQRVELKRVEEEHATAVKAASGKQNQAAREVERLRRLESELYRTMPTGLKSRLEEITRELDPCGDLASRIKELESRLRMTDGAIQAALNRPNDAEIAERGEYATEARSEILESLRPLHAKRDQLNAERLEIEQRATEPWPNDCESIQ